MKTLTAFVVKLADWSSILLLWAVGLGLAILLGAVATQVLGRHLFHVTPAWAEILASLMMTWISFLGEAYAVRVNENMAITLLADSVNGWARAAVGVVILGFSAWFSWMLFSAGVEQVTLTANSTIIGLGLSSVWLYLSAPVAAVFMFLFLFEGLLVRRWPTGGDIAE